MPKDKPYKNIMDKQRPTHDNDAFSVRHPKMSIKKRAKLFSPFDALRGFNAEIDIAKDSSSFIHKPTLDEDEKEKLNRQLMQLYSIYSANRKKRLSTYVTVCYFNSHDPDDISNPVGYKNTVTDTVDYISRIDSYMMVGGVKSPLIVYVKK